MPRVSADFRRLGLDFWTEVDRCHIRAKLLFGLALLLRQVWVWLTGELARSRQARPKAGLGEWPLQRLRSWLAEVLQRKYPKAKVIEPQQPLPWLGGLPP